MLSEVQYSIGSNDSVMIVHLAGVDPLWFCPKCNDLLSPDGAALSCPTCGHVWTVDGLLSTLAEALSATQAAMDVLRARKAELTQQAAQLPLPLPAMLAISDIA